MDICGFVLSCSAGTTDRRPLKVLLNKVAVGTAAVAAALTLGAADGGRLVGMPAKVAAAEGPEWSYCQGSPGGPRRWGRIFENCLGEHQSPIDVRDVKIQRTGALTDNVRYSTAESEFTVQIIHSNPHYKCSGGDCGTLTWRGENYPLAQIHFHSPAENLIEGRLGDLEMHLVHVNPVTKKIVVVGVIFSAADKTFYAPGNEVGRILKMPEGAPTRIAVRNLVNKSPEGYYHWLGSLTTPNCREGVTWLLMDTVHEVPADAVESLFDFTEGPNARPKQKNSNPVTHYIPKTMT